MPRDESRAAATKAAVAKREREERSPRRPPHTDSADTARRKPEIERQFQRDRQAELRRHIPTATTAKTPRRKPLTRQQQLELAVDHAMRREPAFKKSARNTRLSSFARDWVFGTALAEPGFDPRDFDEWGDVAALAGAVGAPLAAGRAGLAVAAPRYTAAGKVRVPHPVPLQTRGTRFVRRNVRRHAPNIAVAEILSQPENLRSLVRIVRGNGTREDYRRVATVAAQAGGAGAMLKALRHAQGQNLPALSGVFGFGVDTLAEFGEDE